MKNIMKIYLAGPDVFLPDPLKIAEAKKKICANYGFMGIFPLDNVLDLNNLSPFESGVKIYQNNTKLMDSCDLIVANMTPFRGPSMDVGTAFELGYMAAQGKPIFAYTNDDRLYSDRVTKITSDLDENGMSIELFQMHDNLMLEGAIVTSEGVLTTNSVQSEKYYTDLTVFEKVIKIASDKLLS
jgi:nucleoside 2-deoxyribosyltransferase